ncbi:MAG: DUF4959 domain-containing protein [Flavobacteriaceae bacterium]|nr:DUF4959 domain-containing protein [Flavobacteriaceae bacterium]
MRNIICIPILLLLISMVVSCESEDKKDTTPPGELTITSTEATYGGAIISYTLPNDDDILFVRADYTNGKGEAVFRTVSKHVNQIEVSGFVVEEDVTISLTVVDENQNKSKSVEHEIRPLQSFIYLVQESVEIVPDLGGVQVSWENIEEKTVFIYLHIADGDEEELRILSSSNATENIFVRGLEAKELGFSTKVEDFDGNITSLIDEGYFTPLFEEKINKDTWTLVSNLSIDGNAYEGATVNFWDDVVDTFETDSDNSYFIINRNDNGGVLRWPLDIVIDLNKKVKINRFKVWQRAFWYDGPGDQPYYYQSENLRSFDLFVSMDKSEWALLGSFQIEEPTNGDISQPLLDEAVAGHNFNLDAISPEFRYLKFSITSNFGSDSFCHGSEISLFGIDNL